MTRYEGYPLNLSYPDSRNTETAGSIHAMSLPKAVKAGAKAPPIVPGRSSKVAPLLVVS
jgi:hypothetical protein